MVAGVLVFIAGMISLAASGEMSIKLEVMVGSVTSVTVSLALNVVTLLAPENAELYPLFLQCS
jgi:hypothetical protein